MKRQSSKIGRRRSKASASFSRKVKDAVRREARKFDCSESFVIVNACAFVLGIPIEESYK